ETASFFAADVQRYLDDEPVQAFPPSRWYRFQKFARRNRGPLTAAAAVFLVLILGMAGTTGGMVRALDAEDSANRQCDIAQGQNRQARAAEEKEREAKERAQKRLGQVVKASEIMTSIFQDLDLRTEQKGDLPLSAKLGQRLDKAMELLDEEAITDSL